MAFIKGILKSTCGTIVLNDFLPKAQKGKSNLIFFFFFAIPSASAHHFTFFEMKQSQDMISILRKLKMMWGPGMGLHLALMSLKQRELEFPANLGYKVKPQLKILLWTVGKIQGILARYFQEGWSHIPSTRRYQVYVRYICLIFVDQM